MLFTLWEAPEGGGADAAAASGPGGSLQFAVARAELRLFGAKKMLKSGVRRMRMSATEPQEAPPATAAAAVVEREARVALGALEKALRRAARGQMPACAWLDALALPEAHRVARGLQLGMAAAGVLQLQASAFISGVHAGDALLPPRGVSTKVGATRSCWAGRREPPQPRSIT